MEDNLELNTSAFNEAAFKMRRLDKLQEICNNSRANPLSRDIYNNSGVFNYYTALMSLFQEVSSKLKPNEINNIKPYLIELRPAVRELNNNLPHSSEQEEKVKWYSNETGRKKFDMVIDRLFDIEQLIRKYLDEKGFATLNVENTKGDQYN